MRSIKHAKGGAVALTIASIILISGIYARWTAASLEQETFSSPYQNYQEIKSSTFGINSRSSEQQEIEANKAQKLGLRLNVISANAEGNAGSSSSFPTIIVNVTDAGGEQLVYDENFGRTYTIQPIDIQNDGPVSIRITNTEVEPIQVSMHISEAREASFGGNFRSTQESFANWLMIISAPIFGLGIWLFIPRQERQNSNP